MALLVRGVPMVIGNQSAHGRERLRNDLRVRGADVNGALTLRGDHIEVQRVEVHGLPTVRRTGPRSEWLMQFEPTWRVRWRHRHFLKESWAARDVPLPGAACVSCWGMNRNSNVWRLPRRGASPG